VYSIGNGTSWASHNGVSSGIEHQHDGSMVVVLNVGVAAADLAGDVVMVREKNSSVACVFGRFERVAVSASQRAESSVLIVCVGKSEG